jgi:cation diffusion facilitator family transporter
VAVWQAALRLLHPQPPQQLGWLAVAGAIGFIGNESVALYRKRVGRRIGSAALVADGVHARTDGFTSLAVVIGAAGVWLGFPLADPIVGILIGLAILVLLMGTIRSIGRRLLDAIEPDLLDRMEHALEHVQGVQEVKETRLRWVGHRLQGAALLRVADLPLSEADRLAREAEAEVRHHLHAVEDMRVRLTTE